MRGTRPGAGGVLCAHMRKPTLQTMPNVGFRRVVQALRYLRNATVHRDLSHQKPIGIYDSADPNLPQITFILDILRRGTPTRQITKGGPSEWHLNPLQHHSCFSQGHYNTQLNKDAGHLSWASLGLTIVSLDWAERPGSVSLSAPLPPIVAVMRPNKRASSLSPHTLASVPERGI